MFTLLDITSNFSNLVMIYPLQFLLVGALLTLGLYELFHTIGFARTFNRSVFRKKY